MPDANPKPWTETTVVGKPVPRIDGREKLSGEAKYALDQNLPDMLYAASVRCPHAHARVTKVDVSRAAAMPGVRAILTDADSECRIPWYRGSRIFDPHCRYEGEEVAVVAAETQQQARDAVRAVEVQYEKLPFVSHMEDALKPGAPMVQDSGNIVQPNNFSRGDVAKGFAEADVVVEETYRTSCLLHTPLEVHGSVAHWEGDHLTIWDSTQFPFTSQAGVARALKIPLAKVRVIARHMGGGFGSKIDLSKHTVLAGLLARKTERPVKYCLSREEELLCVGNRPAHTLRLKAGVKKDGTLTAFELHGNSEIGAYPAGDSAAYLVRELYVCPNVKTEEAPVFINAGQSRAFRAPGFPQSAWALEQTMDALAEKIGMDPVEFRLKNISMVCGVDGNKPYTSIGLPDCLREGAKRFGWTEARAKARRDGPIVRGVGVAAGMWGYLAPPNSTAIVRFFADGSVNLNTGAADLGTGTRTIMAQVVAEELGVPMAQIEVENADTGTTQFSDGAGGSKTCMIDSPAVRAAALDVKAQLLEMASAQLKVPAADLKLNGGEISDAGGAHQIAVGRLNGLRAQQVVVGVGTRAPHPANKAIRPFATHFAEVEVNKRTGEVRVVRMLAAQDSGRVMNLLTYRNQVLGGMTQGIGFALTERRVLDGGTGKMVNRNFHDYKIPTAMDVPAELTVLPIDPHDTEVNSTGTKGLGEPALVPAAAAIANAFYHATGVRLARAPITPAAVLEALNAKRG
ncbi:MAG TPA: xanthine dehydrogenase family protein molybdopterin-binding subunit [Bryobacteraceae bacterium]|nr:xanthine dehydrogenase family protein molybdopterin-binding subunit [Bryobacteraceae bacterium]